MQRQRQFEAPRNRRRRGLTLLELLLAMAGTGMVAVAVSSMLFTVSHGTSSKTDMRKIVVRQKTLGSRITAAIRESKMVLESDTDLLILWVNDENENDQPELAELRRIERSSVTNSVISYRSPDDIADEDNTQFDLATTDFAAETDAVKATSVMPAERWGLDVANWAISLNDADPQAATLVSYQVTLTTGGMSDTHVAAAALRNTQ